MTANSALTVTELDFDRIQENLKSFLSQQDELVDYNFDSSIISLLVDLLAYNTYYNAYYNNVINNESYLDSALLRENVVSRAKAIGYVPRTARGASATIELNITAPDEPENIVIPKDTTFTATLDGLAFTFVTDKDQSVRANDSGEYITQVNIVEGAPLTHRFTVSSANPVRYILPNANIDSESIEVYVQNSASDTTTEKYILADDINSVTGTSPVYFFQEVQDQYIEIVFGDGVLGKAPINNNVIVVKYRVTNGAKANNISVFQAPTGIAGYGTFTSTVISASSAGADVESIQSIKFNAPRNFETQNRAVSSTDYRNLILRQFPDISSISIWGGEENIPPRFGEVFISVKPLNSAVVSETTKEEIRNYLERYNILPVRPQIVDATFVFIKPVITIRYNSDRTTKTPAQILAAVQNDVIAFESTSLGTFESRRFIYSQFIESVNQADASIVSNLTDIKILKRFIPDTTRQTTYTVDFKNAIEPGSLLSTRLTINGNAVYIDDDSQGRLRIFTIQGITPVYLNNNIGTLDYTNGIAQINSVLIQSFIGDYLELEAEPVSFDVRTDRNSILLIAASNIDVINDTSGILELIDQGANTQGNNTAVNESGIA